MNFDTPAIYRKYTVSMALVTLLVCGCVNPETNQQSTKELKQENAVSADNANSPAAEASLKVDVVILNEAREPALLREVMAGVNNIYRQCRIAMTFDTKNTTLAPEQTIDSDTRTTLAQQFKKTAPTIFFVKRTAEDDVAYAHLPSLDIPPASTIWITERVNERCLAWITAHELGHVLLDSGRHSNGTVNVMSNACTLTNWNNSTALPEWTPAQCTALHQSPFFAE